MHPEQKIYYDNQAQVHRNTVEMNIGRVAQLGKWGGTPSDHARSLLSRIPKGGVDEDGVEFLGSGFDGGVAVALGLTKVDGNEFGRLSASLHVDQTELDYAQVRKEIKEIKGGNFKNDTAMWLIACTVCNERGVTSEGFWFQVQKFTDLREGLFSSDSDGQATQVQAIVLDEVANMRSAYDVMDDGVVWANDDSGIVGAYIDGYKFAVFPMAGLFFIGSYLPSLGLEEFQWGTSTEEINGTKIAKSGPIHGQQNFVKCASMEELSDALKVIKTKLL